MKCVCESVRCPTAIHLTNTYIESFKISAKYAANNVERGHITTVDIGVFLT